MRILVVSDTHGRFGALYNVIQSQPNAEVVIHLGDVIDDLERIRPDFPDRMMVCVPGNCDFFLRNRPPEFDTLRVEGKTIFFTHGHIYHVKRGDELLEQAARSRNADICLFGHTHSPLCEYRDGLYMLNPGSLGQPSRGKPSYGIIDITEKGVVPFIREVNI